MLKRRIGLSLAFISGILTITIGLIQDIPILTICYRAAISFVIFGFSGYLFGGLAESFLENSGAAIETKGQKIDIIANDNIVTESNSDESVKQPHSENKFSPFSPESFEHISGGQ